MAELSPIILPLLEISGSRHIVEVGGEAGGTTRMLLDYVERVGGTLVTIDVSPQESLRELFRGDVPGSLVEKSSLQALPEVTLADCYLIDGDHNYYTVLHELAILFGRHHESRTHPLVFLHDIGWPCGYRDTYYNPDAIPLEWRQPHCFELGMTLDQRGLVEGGFRGCTLWAPAVTEGGDRNGVRKAVEDFLSCCAEELTFRVVPAVFGLGIVYSPHATWAGEATRFLAPFHENQLLARLERNRLQNYLRVLELQDQINRLIEEKG
jgi:hypothetical protein